MYNKETLYVLITIAAFLLLYKARSDHQSVQSLLTAPQQLYIASKLRYGVKLDQGSKSLTVSSDSIQLSLSNQPILTLKKDQKLGIGTDAPTSRFHLNNGDLTVNSLSFQNTNITGTASIKLSANSSNDLVVQDNFIVTGTNPKFGIGSTRPNYTLDATDTATFNLGGLKTIWKPLSNINISPFYSSGTLSGPVSGNYTFTSNKRYGTIAIDAPITLNKKISLTVNAASSSTQIPVIQPINTINSRYIKIRFPNASSTQRNIAIAEIKVYDRYLTNVVTSNLTVTASTTLSSNNSPSMAIDNNPSTFWHPVNDSNPWIQLDLGTDTAIYMVVITVRQEPLLYGRQLGMVIDCIQSSGTVVYTSNPAHSPLGNTVYLESSTDGYPYYYYVPSLGTTTNASYSFPIIEPTVLCSTPIPTYPSNKFQIMYTDFYFVLHDGTSVYYVSPLLSSSTAFVTPPFMLSNSVSKLFLAIVAEANFVLNFNLSISETSIPLSGQLLLNDVVSNPYGLQVINDGKALLNEYNPHTIGLKSQRVVTGGKPIQFFMDADNDNQLSSMQSIITDTSVGKLSLNPRGGSVGIGTINPVEKLEVIGKTKAVSHFCQSAVHSFAQPTDNGQWFKIASFIGTTYGEFIISWDAAGEHGIVRFNASCSYNGWNVINITGATFYSTLFDQLRISTDNSSIYNTNYIEIHTRSGSWYETYPTLSIYLQNTGPINGGLTVLSKTTGTSSGYTYYTTSIVAGHSSQLNTKSMFFNGSLGINTNAPAVPFEVTDNTKYLTCRLTASAVDTGFDMVNSDGLSWRIATNATGSSAGIPTGSLYFQKMGSNAGVKTFITPSGWVGIGTTNPISKIDVYANSVGDGGTNYITARNISSGDAWAGMRLWNDSPNACYWFLNASTRTADGGQNVCTLRNDAGRLRLSNKDGLSNIMMDGGNCTVNTGSTTFPNMFTANSDSYHHGKLVIQDGVDGGSSRGIWMWNSGDANWGIYMASSGGGKSLNGGTAPAGYGFSSHALRFRFYDNTNYGVVFENANNQLLASIRADGYCYFWNMFIPTINYNRLFANDWYRHTGSAGFHWESYGKGLQSTDNGSGRYGTISTYGGSRNGWYGFSINDWGCFMSNGWDATFGIHKNSNSWVIRATPDQIYMGDYCGVTFSNNTSVTNWLNVSSNATFGTQNFNGWVSVNNAGANYPLNLNGGIRSNDHIRTRTWYIAPAWNDTELQFFSDWYGHMNSMFNNGTWWRGSDINIKTDIKTLNISSSIKKITGLKPVSYIHKNTPEIDRQKDRTVGFVAQQVQTVNPYCVSEQISILDEYVLDKNGDKIPILDEDGNQTKDEHGAVQYKKEKVVKDKKLGICYEELYVHAINVIKSQHKEVEDKQNKIQFLSESITKQQQLINILNSGITKLESLIK